MRQAQYDSTLTAAQEIAITSAEALSHPEKISKLLVEYGLPPAKLYLSIEDLEVFFYAQSGTRENENIFKGLTR